MFTPNGELDFAKLPRVLKFIIIGVVAGVVVIFGLTYLFALFLVYVAPLAFIFLVLTGIDTAVENRRGIRR
jgi:ABC-type transport system involved in cytochrome bd biosynthesis fused ATPase/permease subunit